MTKSCAGYDRSLRLDKNMKVQTANKIIDEADKFMLDKLKVMERSMKDFEITTYDSLSYDVVLGLDFFKNTELLIDFKKSELTITL